MTIGTTKKLAHYISGIQYEDLPENVRKSAICAVIDCIGNMIAGSIIDHRTPFMKMARLTGGGIPESTLLRNQTQVSMSAAAFGNCALSTMIDFCDGAHSKNGHIYIWPGAVTVPAALAAVEAGGGTGKLLLTSVVAGYECAARIIRSMDIDTPLQADVQARGPSVFCSAGAVGRALGLDPKQMTSALGMAGVYCPVSAGYRFYADEGLTPRADITHGWAWLSMAGAFAAQSAGEGLEMLQDQNILDGDRGLWRMIGMNVFDPEIIVGDIGKEFYITAFNTKKYPGCAFTNGAIIGVNIIINDHSVKLEEIKRIDIATNRRDTVGFSDQAPSSLVDRMFSLPEQVSISLVAGKPGPNWYSKEVIENPIRNSLVERIFTTLDDECDDARDAGKRLTKVSLQTESGHVFSSRVEGDAELHSLEQVEDKFRISVGQVVGSVQAEKILQEIHKLPNAESIVDLMREISA